MGWDEGQTPGGPSGPIDIADVTGLQGALDGKADTSHTHAIAAVTGLQGALDGKADTSHTHAIAAVTGLQGALDGKADTSHTHAIAAVTGLQGALDGKADTSHTHAIAAVTGLQGALDGKLPSNGGDLSGNIRFTDDGEGITTDTADGSDNQSLLLAGGGAAGISRGGHIYLCGNEHATHPGRVLVQPGLGTGNICQARFNGFDGNAVFVVDGWGGNCIATYGFQLSGGGIWTMSGNDSLLSQSSNFHRLGIRRTSSVVVAYLGYAGLELPNDTNSWGASYVGISNGGVTGRLEISHTDRCRVTRNGNLQMDLQEGLHIHRPRTAAVNNGANSSAITASTDKGGLITVVNASDSKSAVFRWETGAAPVLVSGDSGHWATTDTGSRACLIDSGSGVLVIKNNLGSSKNFSVHAIIA